MNPLEPANNLDEILAIARKTDDNPVISCHIHGTAIDFKALTPAALICVRSGLYCADYATPCFLIG